MNLLILVCALVVVGISGISAFGRNCEPSVRRAIIPNFPAVAMALKESGEVRVSVTVDTNGAVTSAKAMSGGTQLRKASVLVAKAWEFSRLGRRDARRCTTRSAVILFEYVLLPNETLRSNESLSYFSYPNKVVVQEIKPSIIMAPSVDPKSQDR